MSNINCEILAPVGRLEDIDEIIDAGADAIYVGLKGYSARPAEADLNFEEIKKAVEIVKIRGVKIYVAINATVLDDNACEIVKAVKELENFDIDAIIVSDWGLIYEISKMKIKIPLHISTLAGVYNSETVELLKELGAKRIILSSDLYVDEIADLIEGNPDLEYELVSDGGVCFNSNRQCLLPHVNTMENFEVYCQLNYKLKKDGSIVGNAKKIGNCPAMVHRTMGIYMGLGIESFKIEGRTNPLWYILKRVREMKESKMYFMDRINEIPGYMHYIYRNADWR